MSILTLGSRVADGDHYCRRCLGWRFHYLTCPALRLPAGYRIAEDLE